MNSSRTSLLSRLAVSSMDLAVRFWPESSREWGQALQAEMGEISEPVAAMNWAAGGMLFFGRAVMSHFLAWIKLPAGTGFSASPLASNSNGRQFPKHSRLLTALVLLAVAILMLLPWARQAERTIKASWHGFLPSERDRQDLEDLAAKAEKEKDARMLAFIALTYPDGSRVSHLADEAVTLDPSLAWIYPSRQSYGDGGMPGEQLKKLKSYDPENAVVYMANAFAVGQPLIENAGGEPLDERLAKNDEWMKNMEAAFRAPKYDSYFQRHQELSREGWRKAPWLSPGAVSIGLWRHSLPNALQIQTYADLRVRQALKAASAGDVRDAESMLAEIAGLGKRMQAGDATPFEQMVGLGLMKRGLEGYKKSYLTNGKTNEANEIQAQLHEVETATHERIQAYVAWREGIVRRLQWKAMLLQATAILSLLLVVATGLSLLVLEIGAGFRRRSMGWARKVICRFVDYGPVALLTTGVVFLWSFRPIAEAFEQYRSGELKPAEVLGLFWEFFVLGSASPARYFYEPYHRWLVGTVALAVVALFVLVRGLARGKTVTAAR